MELEKILNIVNEEFGVDIRTSRRKQSNINALKTYMYLAKKYSKHNFIEIGKRVNRSHSSVSHHCSELYNIKAIMKFDKELKNKFEASLNKIRNMNVKIKKLDPKAVIPKYAKHGDAGLDLTAISKSYDDHGNVVYGTGLAFEIPLGYVGLLFPRSSNANKNLILSNSVGVIDSGYRGEVSLKFKKTKSKRIVNTKEQNKTYQYQDKTQIEYKINDRVGQLIIVKIPYVSLEVVDELSESERGTGAYGSTGQ